MKSFALILVLATCAFAQDLKDLGPLNIIDLINGMLQLTSIGDFTVAEDVKFFLYTRENWKSYKELTWKNMELVSSTKPIKIIIHGWLESANRTWYKVIKDEFLKNGDYSVIQIDWSKPGAFSYAVSSVNTKLVGTIISDFIVGLVNSRNIPYSNFHIIGHSLGAHVAGFVGQNVYKSTSSKIHRISGLDPAGPLFESSVVDKSNRLNNEDAEVVDIIHTDGGIFGFVKPIGTVDFYPNGGFGIQPGCFYNADIKSIGDFMETGLKAITLVMVLLLIIGLLIVFCSHTRSYKIFSEAINNSTIEAVSCKSYQEFVSGACISNRRIDVNVENIDSKLKGPYYLNTNDRPPYLN